MGRRFRRERHKSWGKYWFSRTGVSANSRIVSRWQDEGETGQPLRREIRRREERLWRKEIEMRYEFDTGIFYLHEKHADKLTIAPKWAWCIEYPNGWARRSVVDVNGSVIYTRWIPPGSVM